MSAIKRLTFSAIALTTAAAVMVPAAALAAGGKPPGKGSGRGGGETTAFANNLSNPVVFASNVGILGVEANSDLWDAAWTGVRVPPTQAGVFNQPTTFTLPTGNVTVWPQAMEGNSWQATWLRNPTVATFGTIADWGDNILGSNATVKSFATNTAIRVEVKLTPTTASAPTFDANAIYMPMVNNGLSGSAEKWAAAQDTMATISGATSPVTTTVFTGGAYIELAKVTDKAGTTVDEGFKARTYPVSVTFVSTETETGGSTGGVAPMRLSGELNASGTVVYGLNLFPAQIPMTAGYYRLTFGINATFDDAAAAKTGLPSLATLNGVSLADQTGTTEGTAAATAVIGRASYDPTAQTTSVVIQITSSATGQRGGGGGGTGGGGGGSHGSR